MRRRRCLLRWRRNGISPSGRLQRIAAEDVCAQRGYRIVRAIAWGRGRGRCRGFCELADIGLGRRFDVGATVFGMDWIERLFEFIKPIADIG